MSIIDYLLEMVKATFGPSPVYLDTEAMRKRRESSVKNICTDLARGNISLIRGKFLTTEELERRRVANLSYKFN